MAVKWNVAYFETRSPAQMSVRVAGKEIQRLELPTGVTIAVCHEGDAEVIGFENEEVSKEDNRSNGQFD